MRHARLIVALTLATSVGCSTDGTPKLCKDAVNHMALALTPAGAGQPSQMEQAVIQKVTDMAIQQCAKEGLSAAQADCILAYKPLSMVGDPRKGLAAATTLNKCPAIAEKRPSWLRVPILK